MKPSLLLSCGAIFSILCLPGCSRGRTHDVVATVLMVHGTASVPHGANAFDPLKRGDLLATGETVRVPSGSEIDIALLPGILLRATGNSDFTIDQLKLTKDGNETQGGMVGRLARIRMDRGSATVSVQLPNEASGQFIATTPHITIESDLDTLLQISADADATHAICVRGSAQVTNTSGQTSTLKEGSTQRWATSSIHPPLGHDDISMQTESARAIKTESALLEIDPPETFRVR